jgi:predicted thioesterase
MDVTEYVKVGMKNELSFVVEPAYTASEVGSGGLPVLATPSMIAFMERTARRFLDDVLPQGFSSVGMSVDIRHLAPTPAGWTVRTICEVLEVDGRRVVFDVEAWDENEKVGEGRHQRMVIDEARFIQRVENKRASRSVA